MRAYLLVALAVSARLSASDDDDDRRPSPRALRRATDAERKFSENAVDARKLDEEKGGATPDLPQASNHADEGSAAENKNTDQELTAALTEASGGRDDIWKTTRRLLMPTFGHDQCATQNCGAFNIILRKASKLSARDLMRMHLLPCISPRRSVCAVLNRRVDPRHRRDVCVCLTHWLIRMAESAFSRRIESVVPARARTRGPGAPPL